MIQIFPNAKEEVIVYYEKTSGFSAIIKYFVSVFPLDLVVDSYRQELTLAMSLSLRFFDRGTEI